MSEVDINTLFKLFDKFDRLLEFEKKIAKKFEAIHDNNQTIIQITITFQNILHHFFDVIFTEKSKFSLE